MDEGHEFIRLKQSMEMVGFSNETQRRIFSVLAAVLHLGNVEYKKVGHHSQSVYFYFMVFDVCISVFPGVIYLRFYHAHVENEEP